MGNNDCAATTSVLFLLHVYTGNAQAEQEIIDISMTKTAIQQLEQQYPDVARWVQDCYPDTVWWTYEGYQQMMKEQQERLESQIGEVIGSTPSMGDIIITQEYIEEVLAEHEEVLNKLQNGIMISKSVDGNENFCLSFDPEDIAMGTGRRELQCIILLNDGTEKTFGPYESADDMLSVIKPYCEEQVGFGNLDQSEADEIISRYAGK